MSFAGHVFDMINRWRYNYSLKKGIRDKYREFMSPYWGADTKNKVVSKYKKISDEELKKFRQKIRDEIKLEKRKTIIASTIVILFFSAIIYYIYKKLFT